MGEFCKACGRALQGTDNIAWRYFGIICGSCFLPFAGYVLKNFEALEAVKKANQISPGIYGEA